MTLTDAQNATLKAHILDTPELNAFPNNEDGAAGIANLLNLQAVPDFTVFKTNAPLDEVGEALVIGISGLTTAESQRIDLLASYSQAGVNPSDADIRALYEEELGAGADANTAKARLDVLWRRLSNEIEKLFATGTGSDVDPAILAPIIEGAFSEGDITRQDVAIARNS